MGNRTWNDIKRGKLSEEAQGRASMQTRQLLEELPLQELRCARALSQVALASSMGVAQSEVSKIERRADLYVSTLRNYIESMGGSLDIVARFPDGAVIIKAFEQP